ncbi:MAG: hypothetical protein NVS3B1_23500 [Marmoricola sp.]
MASDLNLTRSVARLENDRDSLYELIDDFRAETLTRFDEHDARFDRLEEGLAEVLRRLPEAI